LACEVDIAFRKIMLCEWVADDAVTLPWHGLIDVVDLIAPDLTRDKAHQSV
jgi:hypothetical protein